MSDPDDLLLVRCNVHCLGGQKGEIMRMRRSVAERYGYPMVEILEHLSEEIEDVEVDDVDWKGQVDWGDDGSIVITGNVGDDDTTTPPWQVGVPTSDDDETLPPIETDDDDDDDDDDGDDAPWGTGVR